MSDSFRDLLGDVFGVIEVPETVPLKLLGLRLPVPERAAIVSAFRRRVMEVHPDLQLAYDHPVLQQAAEEALSTLPDIRELVWARDVLMEIAPRDVTDSTGITMSRGLPVTPKPPKPLVCVGCRTTVKSYWVYSRRRGGGFCYACQQAHEAKMARERRRRRRAHRQCAACQKRFTPSRSDGQFCSPRCRQKAYRGRCVTTTRGSTAVPPASVTLQMTVEGSSA